MLYAVNYYSLHFCGKSRKVNLKALVAGNSHTDRKHRGYLDPNTCTTEPPCAHSDTISIVFTSTFNPASWNGGSTLVKVLCYKSEGRWFDSSIVYERVVDRKAEWCGGVIMSLVL